MSWDDTFKWIGNNSGTISNIAQAITPLVSLYGANKQSDLLKQQNDLQTMNYFYNKSLNDREVAKENLEQENITSAFDNVFGTDKRKKKDLKDYYGTSNYSA